MIVKDFETNKEFEVPDDLTASEVCAFIEKIKEKEQMNNE